MEVDSITEGEQKESNQATETNGEVQAEEKPCKELTEEEKKKVNKHSEIADGNIKTAAASAIAAAAVKAKVFPVFSL